MNDSFNNFKRQAWRNVFIKCALAALTVALWAVNLVLLPCLLAGVHLLWVWYVLIALGGCALGFGVAFAFLRINDRKLAQQLDKELNLAERVQTAYVYKEQQTEMLALQRNDADSALFKASTKRLRFGNIALAIALSVVLALGIVALPVIAVYADVGSQTEQPPVDPPRPVTDWEWQALDDLIDYVKASVKADEQAKSGMVTALEGLRGVLQNGVSQSGLKVFVQNAITDINNSVGAANEREDISLAQKEDNDAERDYVINRLNEIFALNQADNDPNNPNGSGNDKPEEPPVSPGNNTGTGDLIINGVPFFDPEVGYVSSGDPETREKYYNTIRQAMLEGTISRSEWEYIVSVYFADLQERDE